MPRIDSSLLLVTVASAAIGSLLTLTLARPISAQAATKVRWEYAFFDGDDSAESGMLMPAVINRYGDKGWELCPMEFAGGNFLFRRQK